MSRIVSVSVPATSANLGPGYDALGLALEIRDFVTAQFTDDNKVTVEVTGQGAGKLPTNESHLIAKTIIDACKAFGTEVTGLHVECKNAIPQGRGLGSSAAAIVAGLVLASELTYARASEDELLQMANAIEGHPDNVAACLLGAMTIAWLEDDGTANSVSMNVHPDVSPVLGIPQTELDTHKARGLIPEMIAHKQNGYVAHKMDSNDLAMGIHWLLENLSLASIEGRKFVENNYSEDIVSQKHIDFYLKSIQDVSQN